MPNTPIGPPTVRSLAWFALRIVVIGFAVLTAIVLVVPDMPLSFSRAAGRLIATLTIALVIARFIQQHQRWARYIDQQKQARAGTTSTPTR